jgi:hypothetical protein
MLKKIVILVVALGFAWSVPSVRARVATALAPAFSLLGPVGYRMQQPMRKYQAETDLKFIDDQLQMAKTEGRPLPSSGKSFNEWLSVRRGAGDRGKDPWGNLYWMIGKSGSMTLGSNGPDGTANTEDDITRNAAIQ